jgi:hypothetical protein
MKNLLQAHSAKINLNPLLHIPLRKELAKISSAHHPILPAHLQLEIRKLQMSLSPNQ